MIGFFDYTVILTYLSLLSAGSGIVISLSGAGHPYWGCLFLMLCGLFDAFDGKVARTKKDRTEMERNFGIQIDSLSDLVAFGVLPACIGAALIRRSEILHEFGDTAKFASVTTLVTFFLYSVLILFILAAMIRLAYFNVTEEERQKTENGARKYYTGLPVTSASLSFPLMLLLDYIIPVDLTLLYFGMAIFSIFAFLGKFQLRKPGLRGILIMVGIGCLEFALLILFQILSKK